MAVNRVEELLHRVSHALDQAGVPYAVIGGNAVAAWVATVDEGAVRATRNVDILLRREDLDRAAKALAKVELDQHEVLGVTMFLDRQNPSPKTGAHVIFAAEKVRETSNHPSPDVDDVVQAVAGFKVAALGALLQMKLEAFRDVDRVHIRDLLALNLVTEEIRGALSEDHLAKLRAIESKPE